MLAHGSERALPALAALAPAELVNQWAADLVRTEPELAGLRDALADLRAPVTDALAAGPGSNDAKVLQALQAALDAFDEAAPAGVVGALWALRNRAVKKPEEISDAVAALRDVWSVPRSAG